MEFIILKETFASYGESGSNPRDEGLIGTGALHVGLTLGWLCLSQFDRQEKLFSCTPHFYIESSFGNLPFLGTK